jgi:FkbM family methyltransferase
MEAGAVAEVQLDGVTSRFRLGNPKDGIQRYLAAGEFYDQRQLRFHQQLIARKRVVLDVGSNIGNHALFYAMHTEASKVICFEPNPIAQDQLRENVRLNGAETIDFTHVSYGVGAERATMAVGPVPGYNLGGTALVEVGEGDGPKIEIAPLDELVIDEPISFIKIDVEGMELPVLKGAEQVFERWRPALASEIANAHIKKFWRWADAHDYHVINAFRMYAANINYVCISKR